MTAHGDTLQDWNPGTYDRFRGQRLRPARDLLAAVEGLPPGEVIDLGCGNGAAAADLRARFADRRLIGVDRSATMLAEARAQQVYDRLDSADIVQWAPSEPPALIFSNAALHWLPDHATLLPRLARALKPDGMLAIQVPHQNKAPSHRLWLSLAEERFPGRIDPATVPGILLPTQYHHLLAPLGQVDLWETEYYQVLPACDEGHPVRRFTESTFARPVLAALDVDERAQLIAAYEAVIAHADPGAADGSVLFPVRRLVLTLRV